MRKHYVYWLDENQVEALREELKPLRRKPIPIKGVACKAMNPNVDVGVVAPEVWNSVCKRQGGWYRESERMGQHLVIAKEPLEGWEEQLEAVIEAEDFVPPEDVDDAAFEAAVEEMTGSEEFQKRQPEGWTKPAKHERNYWKNLLAKLGLERDFDRLLQRHSANHANFIEPRFYVEGERGAEPYSMGNTAEVCSACVELFNILGKEFDVKHVMPCPGFVTYTGTKENQYMRVETSKKR